MPRLLIALLATFGLVTACAAPSEEDQHIDRMATEHANDEPTPSPAAEVPPAAPVLVTAADYADGTQGTLARPATGEARAGIIVIHEWWGLNDNIVSMAKQLAGDGYAALAVDLYGGEVATERDDAMRLMRAAGEAQATVEGNLRQAYAYLTETVGVEKVGVIGWCFGGGWSLRTALLMPDNIDGAVIYYGRLITEPAALEPLAMPVLGIFGSEDQGIPIDSVRAFETALRDLGKDADIHVYDGADHAFANPSGGRYDEAAATDAWQKTLTFFARTLG